MKPEQSEPHHTSSPSATDRAAEAASSKGAEIREKAQSAKENLKAQSTAAAKNLKESGRDYASGKKEEAADRIGRYGKEFDEAAESFQPEDPNIAWLTHRAADRLTGLAEGLREKDFRSLWHDAEDVARRHPMAFMGGMFAAGAAIGSFVRASHADSEEDEEYASGREGGALIPEEDMLATPASAPTSDY